MKTSAFAQFKLLLSRAICALIVVLLTLNQAYGQRMKHETEEGTGTFFGLRAGVWVPVARLSKTFDPSNSYEFVFGSRAGNMSFQKINYYFSFTLPKGNAFKFTSADTTVLTRSNLIVMGGFRWRQEEKLAESNFFDFYTLYCGIGAAAYFVDYKNAEGDRRSFANVHWHIGWVFSKRISGNQFLGINAQYNLVPQRGIKESVGRKFGNTSVNLAVEYRF